MPEISINYFATYYLYYIEILKMIKSAYNSSLLKSFLKLRSLLFVLSNYIFKIIKLSYSISKVGTNYWFAIYHSYYKEKPGIIKSTNELVTNLVTSLFVCNSNTCIAQQGLLARRENYWELLNIFLTLFNPRFLCLARNSQKYIQQYSNTFWYLNAHQSLISNQTQA